MSRYPTIDQPTTPLDGNGLPYQRLDAPLSAFAQPAGDLAQATDLLALGAKQYREQLLQHQLLAHESAASDALNQYRIEANDSWRRFGSSKMRDAVEGHDGYQQSLAGSRSRALVGLTPAALAMLRPHLDREHQDRVRLGEAYRNVQDQAWADHSSLASLNTDIQEAVMHRSDPQRVMQLAVRGDGEWFKIGERKGWNEQQIADQARASRGRLYGAVIDQQLHEGDIPGATTLLAGVQNQLDPATATQLGGKIQLAQARIDTQSDVPVLPSDAARGLHAVGVDYAYPERNPIKGDNVDVPSEAAQFGAKVQLGEQQLAQAPVPATSNSNKKNPPGKPKPQPKPSGFTPEEIWQRDKAYLDKYYFPAAKLAKEYGVNPEFILALGIESAYASSTLYGITKDAFGMTNGGLTNMTTASDPEDNLRKLLRLYGNQIRNTGNDRAAFINGMLGKDAQGNQVKGWRVYNPGNTQHWLKMMDSSFPQMNRAVSRYVNEPGH